MKTIIFDLGGVLVDWNPEYVFIDDRVSNVQGAINCGIKGIHFQSSKQLIRELKKLNIEI